MPKGVYQRTEEHNRKNGLAHKGNPGYWLGKKRSKDTIEKIIASKKGKYKGEQIHNWKGDDVGYVSLHKWVNNNLGKSQKCSKCGTIKSKYFHWANISGEYKRSNGLNDWIRLCVKCHRIFDSHLVPRGIKNGMSKLNNEQVVKIRKEYSIYKTSQYELARKYNVSRPTISKIIKYDTWKHIH